jgi:hypothetical protein
MLILGGRYGSVNSTTALSYTELEYDYAVSKDKPLFAAVISDSGLENKIKLLGSGAIESEHPQELKLFRQKVLTRISSFFNDAKDVKLAVHETLSDFLTRYDFKGWVSGADVENAVTLVQELSRLRKLNTGLEEEVAELKKARTKPLKAKGEWDDAEFEEIIQLLRLIIIDTSAFDETKEPMKIPLLNIVIGMRDQLITGIKNQAGMSSVGKLLYYNVCPKLQVHGLAMLERVSGVRWERYRLTPKGMALLAFIDKQQAKTSKTRASSAGREKGESGVSGTK